MAERNEGAGATNAISRMYDKLTGPQPDGGIPARVEPAFGLFVRDYYNAYMGDKNEEDIIFSADFWSGEVVRRAFKASRKAYEDYRLLRDQDETYYEASSLHNEKKYEEALKLFKSLMEKGNLGATFMLGVMYYHGQGVSKDYDKARYYVFKAVRGGDKWSQKSLGDFYKTDNDLLGYDLNKAYYWYQRAAHQNLKEAERQAKFIHGRLGSPLVEKYRAILHDKWTGKVNVNGREVSIAVEFRHRTIDDSELAYLFFEGNIFGGYLPTIISVDEYYDLDFSEGYWGKNYHKYFNGKLSKDKKVLKGKIRYNEWGSDFYNVSLVRKGEVPDLDLSPGIATVYKKPEVVASKEAKVNKPQEKKFEVGDACSEVLFAAEKMPEIIGGLRGVQSRVSYPDSKHNSGEKGRVMVEFVVGKTGEVLDTKIIRGLGPVFDKIADNVIRETQFEPGISRGQPACVQMSLPIMFRE